MTTTRRAFLATLANGASAALVGCGKSFTEADRREMLLRAVQRELPRGRAVESLNAFRVGLDSAAKTAGETLPVTRIADGSLSPFWTWNSAYAPAAGGHVVEAMYRDFACTAPTNQVVARSMTRAATEAALSDWELHQASTPGASAQLYTHLRALVGGQAAAPFDASHTSGIQRLISEYRALDVGGDAKDGTPLPDGVRGLVDGLRALTEQSSFR